MTDADHEISDEPPRDDQGHPIHPERGHRICGAVKSDRTTPTDHGRERDEYGYCLLAAGWGEDRNTGPCSKHPVTGEQWGESNSNFKNGATSEYFKSKLSERQRDVYDEVAEKLADPDEAKGVLRQVATQMILVGEHSNDPAMVREGRQMLSEFNIVDNTDSVEVDAKVESEQELTLDDGTRETVREVLSRRREVDDE